MRKNKLKKLIAFTVVLTLSTSVFIGCKNNEPGNTDADSIMDSVISVETALKNARVEGDIADSKGTELSTTVYFTPGAAAHGNPAVNGGPEWSMEPIIYDYLCDYSSKPEKTFKPSLLESYEFKDKVLTLKLKDGLKWSDGSDITIDDLMCNLFVDMTVNNIAYYAESVKKIDDLTIQVKYIKEATLLLDYILKTALKYPVSNYGEFAKEYQDAFENYRIVDEKGNYKFTEEGDKKVSDATSDLNKYLPDLMSIKVSGAYVPKTMTSAEMIFEQNPYYRVPLHIEKIRGIRPTSTESNALAISNGDYDAEGMGLSPDLALKVAENNKETIRQIVVPEFSTVGFCMNTQKYPSNDVNVRKAIAYIIDIEQIAPVSEPGMVKGDEYAVALPPSVRDKYLSKDFLNSLENYDVNLEKAEEYLEKAGWSKKANQWVDENGESPEIIVAGAGEYPNHVVIAEAATNMMKDFGLNAVFTPKEAAAYNDYVASGDAHMTVDNFGGAISTQHPHEAYSGIWWYGKRGMNLKFPEQGELIWKNEETNKDFNYSEKMTELFDAATDEEISSVSEEFAKFFNDNVWFIPVTEKNYIFRIHNPKLSMPEAETGVETNNFYWSGTPSAILGKSIRSEELYYIK
ncbi:ABC transporter substrate-binding protein [Clostridium sp.]|uniref:ABC transporter substrate-binding protein n=1 Tax=Clostridium sp. TaxID=1506 RepID=UPI0025BE83ED|nr:ABC transporter substrate-binding protein [Clostridium sp.]